MTGLFRILSSLARHPSGMLALLMLGIIAAMAALAGVVAPDGPWALAGGVRIWPGQNPDYLLGTDNFGRDMVAGLFYGARVSILVGLSVAGLAIVAGLFVGAVAGYYGGAVDDVLMRFTDAVQTIPSFLAALAIVGVVGPSLGSVVFAIAIVNWPMIARLVRAEFLRLKSQDFVSACRIAGMSNAAIIWRQLLPNCLTPVVVAGSLIVGSAILTEAGLSFLGLGDPDQMSWGTIIGAGRTSIRAAWYIVAIPSVAIVVTVIGLNLLSDALNDALNPRLNQE